MTSSDYVLVPVLPEDGSTDAVPRLLTWLKELRPLVCPDLAVLGVLGNKAKFFKGKIISRQRDILSSMSEECVREWGQPVRQFTPIKVHEDNGARFASLDPKFQPAYRDLIEEILKELPTYARCRTPAVSPVLG